MIEEEKINKRLLKEIKDLDAPDKTKDFLEELLIKEKSNSIGWEYKNKYKDMIKNSVDQ